jgi:hypothetical protein
VVYTWCPRGTYVTIGNTLGHTFLHGMNVHMLRNMETPTWKTHVAHLHMMHVPTWEVRPHVPVLGLGCVPTWDHLT